MEAFAVVLHEPEKLELSRLALTAPGEADVVVDIEFSGISTGTEKLLWQGTMPSFPGMGYPLVPGYESVGRISEASCATNFKAGQRVFVPGAKCFGDIRGFFGGAASRLVVPAARVIPIDENMGEQGTLLALAATAYHAAPDPGPQPELIIGHGVLGRLLARIVIAAGGPPPTVWEINPDRTAAPRVTMSSHPMPTPAATIAASATYQATPPCSISSSAAWHPVERSSSPASTPSACPSPSPPRSCAKCACASCPKPAATAAARPCRRPPAPPASPR